MECEDLLLPGRFPSSFFLLVIGADSGCHGVDETCVWTWDVSLSLGFVSVP